MLHSDLLLHSCKGKLTGLSRLRGPIRSTSNYPAPFHRRRGAFALFVKKSSAESNLWEERNKKEQNPAEEAKTSSSTVPCGSTRSVSQEIFQQSLKILLFIAKMKRAAPLRLSWHFPFLTSELASPPCLKDMLKVYCWKFCIYLFTNANTLKQSHASGHIESGNLAPYTVSRAAWRGNPR